MASLLRSGSFLRIFSGFKHSLASSYSRYEVTRLQKLQTTHVNLSIVRSFATQKPLENVPTSQKSTVSLDQVLYRIDGDIRRFGRVSKKSIDDIFGKLKDLEYASSTQSLLLIRCCGSLVPEELPEVRNELVQEIWDTLIKFNIPLDISHYNALLKVYLENEHKFSPTEYLSTLEQNGIEPNRVTYQRLISRYCHEGDIDGASKILEFMKEKQLPVNENVFNALIMGHARANDMESAHGVIGVMQGAGLEPSSDTYMMLLIGYAEKGDIEGLYSALQECEAADIQVHNREYMEVILALASKGHQNHVSQFIEKLEKVTGYQQDTMNLIFRLLNGGCDEVAYQLFETMSVPQNIEGETVPVGTFFIRHLIKSGLYSVGTTVQYCQKMRREGLNMYTFERALECALVMGRLELAMALSRVMIEDSITVRSHYFWPMLVHYGKQGEKEMVYNTVREMVSMDMPLTLETCRDYLFPVLIEKDMDEEPVIMKLKECGIPVPAIINGCIAYYLRLNDVVAPAQLVVRYRVRIPHVLRKDLAAAYIKSKAATAAAAVLGQMTSDSQRKEEATAEDLENNDEVPEKEPGSERAPPDIAGMFLMDVLMMGRITSGLETFVAMLKVMESRGIPISNNSARALQNRLGEHTTEDITKLLENLSSGDMTFQPLSRDEKPINPQSIEELELKLTELEIKNRPQTIILSQLLLNYARIRNVEKAEEIKQKLNSLEFPLSAANYAMLIDMYAVEGKLEKALSLYEELKRQEPDSKLNPFKAVKLATAMVMEGQIEEAVKMLEENAPDVSEEKDEQGLNVSCRRLLDCALEKIDTAAMQRLFDTVLNLNYTKASTIVCGPLVRVYLNNNDLVGAMEAFEKICKEHSLTPGKHELTLACIKQEDADKLQKIMDLSAVIHGEMNSLYDLVFAFLECGKIRQAKKILETPGLRARHQRLEQRCKRFVEEERYTELEHLVTITKDVFDVDRNMMFMYLFEAYKKLQDCDKAFGIWTTMQEENIEPSESFLWELGQFLTKHNRDVPFAMPTKPDPPVAPVPVKAMPTKRAEAAPPKAKAEAEASSKSFFRKAVQQKDFDLAFQEKKRIEDSGSRLSITDESILIEGLLQEQNIEEAVKLAREMVIAGQYPLPRIFRYLLNRLSAQGDVESFTFFDKYIDEDVKKSVSYMNRLCNAYIVAGRAEEYLDQLFSLVESTDIENATLKSKIPAGGIMGILERQTDLLPKVISFVEKCANRGILIPANCVWMHHFNVGSDAEAKEVYDKYLSNSNDNLMFTSICRNARITSNAELLPPLIEILNTRPSTTENAKGIVYSCWIDILCSNQKYEESLSVLENGLKEISLENFNNTALLRIKGGLAASNKTFPYAIPSNRERRSKQPSSSSSSDSD